MELKDLSKSLKENYSGMSEQAVLEELEKTRKKRSGKHGKIDPVLYPHIESSSEFEFLSNSALDFLNLT